MGVGKVEFNESMHADVISCPCSRCHFLSVQSMTFPVGAVDLVGDFKGVPTILCDISSGGPYLHPDRFTLILMLVQ